MLLDSLMTAAEAYDFPLIYSKGGGYMPMFTDEQVMQAKQWFIERFFQTDAGRSFALREHGLIVGAKIKSHVRKRQARFDVAFLLEDHNDFLLVSPRTPEARWCYGVIRLTPRGTFYYRSLDFVEQLRMSLEEDGTIT